MNISERASELRRLRAEAERKGLHPIGVFENAAYEHVDELARFCEEAWALLQSSNQMWSLLTLGGLEPGVPENVMRAARGYAEKHIELLARYSSEPAPKENP